MPTNLLQYPANFKWTNRLTYFFEMYRAPKSAFRLDEWLRFMHREDLQELLTSLVDFNAAGPEAHQDLVLLNNLLFTSETGVNNVSKDSNLSGQLIKQLVMMVHLETLRCDGLIYIEQRLSIRPGFIPEVLITSAGKAFIDKYGELPECPGSK